MVDKGYVVCNACNAGVIQLHSTQCPMICYTTKCGVSQGSILGPFLFNLFITKVGDIYESYNIKYHGYADDQQVYCSFDPNHAQDINGNVSMIDKGVSSIRSWTRVNTLKLNDAKTEVILFGTKSNLQKVENYRVRRQ